MPSSYNIFPKGVNDLPQVLAGPIVKMVSESKVQIWVATRSNFTASLKLWDTGLNLINVAYATNPIKLGDNLYIVLAEASGLTLSDNTKYYYDITFQLVGGGPTYSLGSPGILNNATDFLGNPETSGNLALITFANATAQEFLPSFITPPSSSNDLRIMHASCRKPHGNDGNRKNVDGMYGAYIALDDHFKNPTAVQRPQQLFLTGDQIYADDIADELLYYIRCAADQLMGSWTEPFSSALNTELSTTYGGALIPGMRASLQTLTGFTNDEGTNDSQLIYLKEFICAYLFFWSGALYPLNNPNPGGYPNLPTREQIYSVSVVTDDDLIKRNKDQYDGLYAFQNTLIEVRRVLANTSTYMIFDDHEICDDLFLDLKWSHQVLGYSGTDTELLNYFNTNFGATGNGGKELGQRVITNGLAAINLCQYLGNYDGLGGDTSFQNFLTNISNIISSPSTLANWTSLQNNLLPVLVKSTPSTYSKVELKSNDYWNFKVFFNSYNVIFLNARTQRGYVLGKKGEYPAQLICGNKISTQLNAPTTVSMDFSIIVAQTPIFGYVAAEESLQFALDTGLSTIEELDYEAWGYNKLLKEYFLQEVSASSIKRVIILSGDVHYAFSNKIKYWDNRSGITAAQESRSTIIQLTSSSLKNEATQRAWLFGLKYLVVPLTTQLGQNTFVSSKNKSKYEYAGWINDRSSVNAAHVETFDPDLGFLPEYTDSSIISPAFIELDATTILKDKINDPPNWSYRLETIVDNRNTSSRSTLGTVVDFLFPTTGLVGNLLLALTHQGRKQVSESHQIVGKNCIGIVSFSGFPASSPQVTHDIYFCPLPDRSIQSSNNYGEDDFKPYTKHVIDFDLESYVAVTVTSGNPKPGYD